MHLKENCNLNEFLKRVKTCNSEVIFKSKEGDILVLKSSLCQYIFLSLLQQPALLYGGMIVCENSADYDVLKEFLY